MKTVPNDPFEWDDEETAGGCPVTVFGYTKPGCCGCCNDVEDMDLSQFGFEKRTNADA